jgi:hypothetical protein
MRPSRGFIAWPLEALLTLCSVLGNQFPSIVGKIKIVAASAHAAVHLPVREYLGAATKFDLSALISENVFIAEASVNLDRTILLGSRHLNWMRFLGELPRPLFLIYPTSIFERTSQIKQVWARSMYNPRNWNADGLALIIDVQRWGLTYVDPIDSADPRADSGLSIGDNDCPACRHGGFCLLKRGRRLSLHSGQGFLSHLFLLSHDRRLRVHDVGLPLVNVGRERKQPDYDDLTHSLPKILLSICLFAATYPLVVDYGLGQIEAGWCGESERLKQIVFGLIWLIVAWVIFHAAISLGLFGVLDLTLGGVLL